MIIEDKFKKIQMAVHPNPSLLQTRGTSQRGGGGKRPRRALEEKVNQDIVCDDQH